MKKWRCRDGIVEFHLAMGPATGGFTNKFWEWVAEESGTAGRFAGWDWRTVPARIESGEVTGADIEEARAVTRAFLATKTKAEVLDAALSRRLLCVGISDTGDVAGSAQLAARDFWSTVGEGERAVRLPARFVTTSLPAVPALHRPAPLLGEHTDEVLAEWLGGDRPAPAGLATAEVRA
jgi:crotonobetainyl-CoA:carnitine CoA-transferase CaiB-like acyl-CoA transferase